jgi:hypothetical protein
MSREQEAPKGGRGAPAQAGDLTPKANVGGQRLRASELGSHPHLEVGPLLRLIGRPEGDVTGRDYRQPPTVVAMSQVKRAEAAQ